MPRLLRRLVVGLAVLVLLPVVLVVGALGLHWLGEVPDARALNAELERAQRVVAGDVTPVWASPAHPRAFTCCGDSGLSASATSRSGSGVAATAARLTADLRAAGWSVEPSPYARPTYASFSAVRPSGTVRVDVLVYALHPETPVRGLPAGTTLVELEVR